MYLAGVSVRRVEDITDALWGARVSNESSGAPQKRTKLAPLCPVPGPRDRTEGGQVGTAECEFRAALFAHLPGKLTGPVAFTLDKHGRTISGNSVSEVFRIADEKEIHYADVRNLGEDEVYLLIYPDKQQEEVMFAAPDYEYIHRELKKPGVTLKLLHDKYVEKCTARGTIPMEKQSSMRATLNTCFRTT